MTNENHHMTLRFRWENYIIFKCITKDVWDLYKYPVYKRAFYFQRHTDYQRIPWHLNYAYRWTEFTHFGSSFLSECSRGLRETFKRIISSTLNLFVSLP